MVSNNNKSNIDIRKDIQIYKEELKSKFKFRKLTPIEEKYFLIMKF